MRITYNQILFIVSIVLHQTIAYTQSDYAVQLDGVDDHLVSANDIYSNADVVDGTIAIWFKTDAVFSNVSPIVDYEGYINISIDPSGLLGGCTDGVCTSAMSSSPYNDGAWHFAVVTWDSNIETNLYVDGVFIDQSVPTQAPSPNTTSGRPLVIGYHSTFPVGGLDYFSGMVDELSIWSKMFSESEVQSLMDSCLTGSESDLLGYWKIESDPALTDSDLTINSNDLTLENGSVWVSAEIPLCCSIDVGVTQSGSLLTANAAGLNYQWIDCDNNDSPIPGETNQSFTATTNGNFAVVISDGACSDTSSCYSVEGLSSNSQIHSNTFRVYPNPTNSEFSVEFDQTQQNVEITIFSLDGKQVSKHYYQEINKHMSTLSCPSGIYTLQIKINDKIQHLKIFKL